MEARSKIPYYKPYLTWDYYYENLVKDSLESELLNYLSDVTNVIFARPTLLIPA